MDDYFPVSSCGSWVEKAFNKKDSQSGCAELLLNTSHDMEFFCKVYIFPSLTGFV